MLKFARPARALGLWLIGLLVAALTLAACAGATEPAAQATPEVATPAQTEATVDTAAAGEQAAVPEATESQEATPAETQTAPEASETGASATAESDSAAANTPAECQTVDIPDNELIAAVGQGEWSKGPVDAPTTLIEYGDFQ